MIQLSAACSIEALIKYSLKPYTDDENRSRDKRSLPFQCKPGKRRWKHKQKHNEGGDGKSGRFHFSFVFVSASIEILIPSPSHPPNSMQTRLLPCTSASSFVATVSKAFETTVCSRRHCTYLLLAECEVRTASYGPSFFLPFMAQARSARAMKTRKEKTRIHNLPYGLSKRG